MSVIEPEPESREIKDEPMTCSEIKDSDDQPLPENTDEEQEQEQTLEGLKEKTPSKKRKSHKSREGKRKKVKETAYSKISAISLQS